MSKADTSMFNLLNSNQPPSAPPPTGEPVLIAQNVVAVPVPVPVPVDVPPPAYPGTPDVEAGAQSVMVRAPANLMGGFKFDAWVNGATVEITVPPNGVRAGDLLPVTIPTSAPTNVPGHNVTVGHFRDGICDCFNAPACCQSCLWTICCFGCSLAQLVQRSEMLPFGSSCGGSSKEQSVKNWSITIVVLYIIYSIFNNIRVAILQIIAALISLFLVFALANMRLQIRQKFGIPSDCCINCEYLSDCCCSLWCSACVTCQLHRQMNDYQEYRPSFGSLCFTRRGILNSSPLAWFTKVLTVNTGSGPNANRV